MRTYDEILNEMKEKYKELTGMDTDESSDIGIRLRVMAGELYALYARLGYLEKQSFYATATGEYLDKHAEQYGLKRQAAARSTGYITLYLSEPLTYNLNIPAGSVCAVGDSLRYITKDACSITKGYTSVTVFCEAEEGGTEYNCAPDTINTLVSVPDEISSVTNAEAFYGGTDIESDEKLRQRLISACAFMPSGANAEFYKNLAYSVDGVSSASATSSGLGMVDIYLWGEGEGVQDVVINEVKALCEENRNIGTAVTVQNANVYEYVLYLEVTPDSCSMESARQAVTAAAKEYFANLNIGDPVYKGKLGAYLMANAPVLNVQFPNALGDFTGSPSTIAVLVSTEVGEI